jgi:hypothetical protein
MIEIFYSYGFNLFVVVQESLVDARPGVGPAQRDRFVAVIPVGTKNKLSIYWINLKF